MNLKTLFKPLIIVCLILLVGCSSTYSTRNGGNGQEGTEVYPISMDDALLIMQNAMQKEFPEDRIEDVLAPHRGYRAKLRFIADIDVISVYAIDGQGRGPNGSVVNGLIFEVHRSGTYPLGGIPKSKAILKRVVEGASRISEALPRI
jgi:hypothetical protein